MADGNPGVTFEFQILPLRLAVGGVLFFDGAELLGVFGSGSSVDKLASHLASSGIPASTPLAWAIAVATLLGGVAIFIGLATRIAASVCAVVATLFLFFGPTPLDSLDRLASGSAHRVQLGIVMIAACVSLAARGQSGGIALDNIIAARKKG
jgi:uncharacterized membrane protein YphA (DoxX/SURF4 family)